MPQSSITFGVASMRWSPHNQCRDGLLVWSRDATGGQCSCGAFSRARLERRALCSISLAFGFQAAVALLMDLGYTSTIIPLVGERHDDRARVGIICEQRNTSGTAHSGFLATFTAFAFLAIMHKHHWSWTTRAVLLLSVLLSLYLSGPVSYYSAPLFLYGRLRDSTFHNPSRVWAG